MVDFAKGWAYWCTALLVGSGSSRWMWLGDEYGVGVVGDENCR